MADAPDRLGRRAFLKAAGRAAAAAVVAPCVISASALGAAGPSNRITVGCIGMGRQAVYSNVRFFLGQDDCQVVAVCDVDAWRLEQAKNQVEKHYAGKRAGGSFKGLSLIHISEPTRPY